MKDIFDNKKFGRFNLNSRIIRSGLWESENDSSKNLTTEIYDRYEELAKNNVGLIISEFISLYSRDRFSDYSHYINTPHFIKEFKLLTDIVHNYDVPIFAQLGFINCNVNGKQMMEVNDLTLNDIKTIQTDYIVGARKIAYAGFDGIQLNIGNNFFFSRVMDPFENQREDKYGGNTYNRVRMILEIIKVIKELTDLHVHCRVNLYKDFEDSLEICRILTENGADSLQITKFLSPQFFRRGTPNQDMLVEFTDKVSSEVQVPVVLGGGLADMNAMNDLLNNSNIEFFSMQRPFVRSHNFLSQWKHDDY
jgi:2,4-dienoyl-CoA reductase-like NADH-dependent reductase (Old Yellow Enzyme family)